MFPNDEEELDRLDLQHYIHTQLLHDALFFAPISKNPQYVLDVGTGTGIWAIDFADLHPSATVIGTDLSPVQPRWVPPNLHFQVDDANDNWTFPHPFDFIHCREPQSAIKGPHLFSQAFQALKPGGWLEVRSTTLPLMCDDGTIDGTAFLKWSEEMLKIGRMMGTEFDNPYHYCRWMRETGFVNVQEKRLPLPVNPWPKDKRLKQIGMWEMVNFGEGLQGFSLKAFTEYLGWSREELEVFLVQVKRDIENKQIHAYLYVICTFGQKPL